MQFHNAIQGDTGWEVKGSTPLFENPYVVVHKLSVTTPTRPEGAEWTLVHRKAAAVVAPQLPDGRFLMVHQERIPILKSIWEFPAGQIEIATEHTDEVIRSTALRELREEAGCELSSQSELQYLGLFYPSCGFTDEHSHLFLATNVRILPSGATPEESERIVECRAFTETEIAELIRNGKIVDANTLSTMARIWSLQR